ncbi:MAG: phosphatidylcholine/phosphatidylserine synthase [Alphaproteobacteria bacterium]|nr:phosphatidylcholine/phosphatidylserine synthase [Alphaproteobacteria bacterium]
MKRKQRSQKAVFNDSKENINLRPLFPNMVTMTALAFGVSSINMALWGNWEWAVFFIFLSMVFDFLDGKAARLLGVSSRFGAELDSLSDFVSFGVAPGVLMYLWSMKIAVFCTVQRAEAVGVYWIFGLFLAMCCATRLARFNSLLDEKQPPYWLHFFMGVPAPAGAGLALLPIILCKATGWIGFRNPVFVGFFLCFSGVMMASRIPTLCLKHLHIPKRYSTVLMVIGFAFLAGLFGSPWVTLSLLGVGYILMIPVCIYYFLKFKKQFHGGSL